MKVAWQELGVVRIAREKTKYWYRFSAAHVSFEAALPLGFGTLVRPPSQSEAEPRGKRTIPVMRDRAP